MYSYYKYRGDLREYYNICLEAVGRKDKTYNELKEKHESGKKERDMAYKKYYSLLEEFSIKREKYNSLFQDMLNNHFHRSVRTDERGRYAFTRIKKDAYYLYAIEGTFINTNVWFMETNLNEDKTIYLTNKNISDIFQ